MNAIYPSTATRAAGGLALAAAITILMLTTAPTRAQQPPPASTPPPKPLVPLTAATLAANPDTYVGEWVSVTGVVEQSLSRLAFAVDQGALKSTGDVLVLAPRLNGPVDPKTYITIVGEVVRFEPDEISKKAKDYALDLSADLVAISTRRRARVTRFILRRDDARTELERIAADYTNGTFGQ